MVEPNVDNANVANVKPEEVNAAVDNQPETKPEPKEDLVTRASKVEVKEEPKTEDKFDVNAIENAKTIDEAKEWALKSHKSFQSDYTRKTQDLATERKTWEAKQEEAKNWTPERVQSLLEDPNFVQAAQNVPSINQTDEYSALSEKEKAEISDNKKQIQMLSQTNANLQRKQQDENLKGKYANYSPEAVDIITNNLLTGKVQATREDLWKVSDYDEAVKRAYQLGLQDKQETTQEKVGSVSFDGTQAVSNKDVPPPNEGESTRDYFTRIAMGRLQKPTK